MFACPGLIFYTVCSVPWLNGNLALAEKCSVPLRFRLRQVLLYYVFCLRNNLLPFQFKTRVLILGPNTVVYERKYYYKKNVTQILWFSEFN